MVDQAQVDAFWQKFLHSAEPAPPADAVYYEAFMFGSDVEIAAECATAVLAGEKTTTSALLWELEAEGKRPPQPGDLSIVLDEHGRPVCVIETLEAPVRAFKDVDEQYAYDYGEGERTLAWWREALWDYFSRECARHGWEASEEMPLICERFRVVYRG